MYRRALLDNGLKIVCHRMPKRQSFSLGIWFKVGGRYEENKNKGIAHFLEHLVFKGSRKYSCRKIKESIEGVGGSLNGFTSEELTCYLVKIPERYFALAVDVLSDMAMHPVFPPEEIEKERTVIQEEIKMYRDLPQSYVYELLDKLLWPGQPLGEPIIGSFESVGSITRDDLASFKNKCYTPANMVVSAAGSVDFAKLKSKVAKAFSYLPAGEPNLCQGVKEGGQSRPQLDIFVKDTEQTHLAMGFHSYSRGHHLRYALGVLHIILGVNMSSRLFQELREKRGLAYEIGSQLKYFNDTGAFLVHAGIDNRKVIETVELILGELRRLKEKPVTRDEFSRAKEFYLGQTMLSMEDTLDHMLWIGETAATLGRTYGIADIIREVKKVTLSDVRRVAEDTFLENKLNLALIGPLEGIRDGLYKKLEV